MTVNTDTPRPGATKPMAPLVWLVWLLEPEALFTLFVIPAGVLPSNDEKSYGNR